MLTLTLATDGRVAYQENTDEPIVARFLLINGDKLRWLMSLVGWAGGSCRR